MTTRTVSGSAYTLGYDAENRLTSVSGAATAGFVYDGDGKRVKETNAYKNLAQGIVVSGSVAVINPDVITNGDTQADSGLGTSREFGYSSANGLQYVQIDLGALFPVNKVSVWHYNGGTRTYHNTKTQVSADGVTWTTVFDSAVSGEYVETLAGKTHTFTQRSVRYVRDYLNGSTANSGNHWTEIEVWGTATTAYVGDYFEWNGSPQTMTRYYSAGGTRVAVRNSNGNGTDGLVYLLGDHLGSTSLTADPLDGDKLSELRYKAWGETRHSLTNAPTDRRYTGQAEEVGIGLYYYGARFYDPLLGRFTSPDSIIPGTGNPLAWDRYSYTFNNPVKYIDSSGHIPILPAIILAVVAQISIDILTVDPITDRQYRAPAPTSVNMTQWLTDRINENAQVPVTQALRENWQSGNPINMAGALKAWVCLVRTSSIWDYKSDIIEAGYAGEITLGGMELNYQAIANINFGAMGGVMGLPEGFAEFGAGAFQIYDNGLKKGNWESVGPAATYFDQPFDYWMVSFGYWLYENYGDKFGSLTPEELAEALYWYTQENGDPGDTSE